MLMIVDLHTDMLSQCDVSRIAWRPRASFRVHFPSVAPSYTRRPAPEVDLSELGQFLVVTINFFVYATGMFIRFLKVFFQTEACVVCRQYQATRGLVCIYCHLDDRLTQPGSHSYFAPARPEGLGTQEALCSAFGLERMLPWH